MYPLMIIDLCRVRRRRSSRLVAYIIRACTPIPYNRNIKAKKQAKFNFQDTRDDARRRQTQPIMRHSLCGSTRFTGIGSNGPWRRAATDNNASAIALPRPSRARAVPESCSKPQSTAAPEEQSSLRVFNGRQGVQHLDRPRGCLRPAEGLGKACTTWPAESMGAQDGRCPSTSFA